MIKKDLTGKRFGKLYVIGFDHKEGYNNYWKVRCDCGNEKLMYTSYLQQVNSCGKCPRTFQNKTTLLNKGDRFGNLTVIEYMGKDKSRHHIYKCKCDCGNEKVFEASNLRRGRSKSCGVKGCKGRIKEKEGN